MAENERPYRRRRIWINSRFQAKYIIVITGVAVAVFAVLGTQYVRALKEQRDLVGVSSLAGPGTGGLSVEDREFDRDLRDGELAGEDTRTTLYLVAVAFVLVAFLVYVAVRITFRAAGPVFAVSQMLRSMAMGDFGSVRRLRKKDEFQFLQDDIFALRDFLRDQALQDVERYRRVKDVLRTTVEKAEAGDRAVIEELYDDLERAAAEKRERFRIETTGDGG